MAERGDSAEYALEEDEVPRALGACIDLEERIIIKVPLYLGLRVGELAHMKAEWLISNGELRIPPVQSCNCAECRRFRGGEWRPKTEAGIRTLAIPRPVLSDLQEYLARKPQGLETSRVTLNLKTKAILKRAGIKRKGLAKEAPFPHALRATCATRLAGAGIDSAALSYIMGWASIRVADHYIRVSRARALAAQQIRRIFG